MTTANLLTLSRLVTVPLIVLSAWSQQPTWFAGLVAYALASDAVDGPIARRLGQATPLGARLDSIADAALYLTAPVAALVLYPVLRERERVTVIVVIAAYLLPIAVGFSKYRRLTAYHTIAARAAGVLLGVAFVVLVVARLTWPLRVAAVLLVLSAIEEITLTLVLPAWRANVPSLWHARRWRVEAPPPPK
jgi:cardiolipin synthase